MDAVPLLRCYVASDLGFTEGGRHYYECVYLPALSDVVEPVDPWTLTSPEEVSAAQTPTAKREFWLRVGARNAEAIRSSHLLVAYLEGQEPDSGTVAEVGYAAGRGLTCFGLRTDLRQAGEPEMALNLQVESFISASGGEIFPSLDDLLAGLRAFCSRSEDLG